jgi:hypothetical protein
MGVTAVLRCNQIKSLAEVVPAIQRGLGLMTVLSYAVFMVIVTGAMIFSNLSLKGY